jgi:acyl-CoA thioesterase
MPTDADFLGLQPAAGDGRFTFTVTDHLTRIDGHLYGGTAIGVSIATAEQVSQRQALWMTTQFVSTAPPQATISVHAEVLAPGRRTNQVRVTGTDSNGDVMFASLGATGHHRAGGMAGTFDRAPEVTPPEQSEPWPSPFSGMLRDAGIALDPDALPDHRGFIGAIEVRAPEVINHPDPGPGRLCMWVRRSDKVPLTAATVAYLADMVPLSVALGCGVLGGGISLDNSIRLGGAAPGQWVLVDLRPHLAVGDYGHGLAHIWNEQLELVATASQTASMMRFDVAAMRPDANP